MPASNSNYASPYLEDAVPELTELNWLESGKELYSRMSPTADDFLAVKL
ncbi:MAG: hypothetical protein ACYSSM_03685 [Planctomycetota bacterium]